MVIMMKAKSRTQTRTTTIPGDSVDSECIDKGGDGPGTIEHKDRCRNCQALTCYTAKLFAAAVAALQVAVVSLCMKHVADHMSLQVELLSAWKAMHPVVQGCSVDSASVVTV